MGGIDECIPISDRKKSRSMMQTILESFIELYGTYDMAEDKLDWNRLLDVFQKGWVKGVFWNQQVSKKYDFPYTDTLHGEKDEDEK